MSRQQGPYSRTGSKGLEVVRHELTGRDLAIIGQVAELRLLSAVQLKDVHFPVGDHDNDAAAMRACQRVLIRLVRDRLLIRLERRLGGVRAGSSSFVYALGSVGQRVLTPDGARRRRLYEPTPRFLDHTLAIAQIVVDATNAARRNELEVLMSQAEPRCHRQFSANGGWAVLKPDLFVNLGVDDYEHRWFVEVDMSTESLPVVLRKCQLYEDYYQTGKEQEAHGVFPKVCWVVPNEVRAQRIRDGIKRDRKLTDRLFVVTTADKTLDVLKGGAL